MTTIELVKKTTKTTGDVYYFTRVDGSMLMDTWTNDPVKAEQFFNETLDKVKMYPADKYDTVKLIEYTPGL